jgi:phytoene dehydrogenase-like protein
VTRHDAVVVGSGPNGLAAAIRLATAGRSVLVVEARDTIGGGARTAELTLPGFHHDVCSSAHPLAVSSPYFRELGLDADVEFLHAPAALAHLMDDGRAVLVERDLDTTAAQLGEDAAAYRRLVAPLLRDPDALLREVLAPLHLPRHPLALARFGLRAILPATLLARGLRTDAARGLVAGCAAHAVLPLDQPVSAAAALVMLAAAHGRGWPVAAGGSQRISDALARRLRALSGEIETGRTIRTAADLPPAGVHLLDTDPRQLARIGADRLPAGFRRHLQRFRRGPAAFKIDYALDGPVPWADPATLRATTVHVGGDFDAVATAEADAAGGRICDKPFLIYVQASVADPSRAPQGRHTGWVYCHVPNGSDVDMTDRIERRIESVAPGFRDRILARQVTPPRAQAAYNRNNLGGDISGGLLDWRQLFTRPSLRWSPYLTPDPSLVICSSSTPPGGGVHGMCGYHAAEAVLRRASARRG